MTGHRFEIEWEAPPEVERALATVGRCEDLRFSPDGSLLVLAGFARHALLLLDVEVAPLVEAGVPPVVRFPAATEVTIAGLELPHGVDFVDDHTLAVANRGGGITLVAVRRRPRGADGPAHRVTEVPVAGGFAGLHTPGSVATWRVGPGAVELLVCNNWGHDVTRHRLDATDTGWTVTDDGVLLRRWLDVPDGVAHAADGRWLAISDHHPQAVLLYARDAPLGPDTEPAGVLRGAAFPHGLRFTPDGEHLLVADAGMPFVHVYAAPPGGWGGVHPPVASVRVLDDETFERGRENPQEGGPKGIDLTPDARVVAVTSEHVPLVLLDGAALLAAAGRGEPAPDPLTYERSVLDHHVFQRSRLDEALARAGAAESREQAALRRAGEAEHRAGLAAQRAEAAEARAVAADAASAEGHLAAQAALAGEAEALERAHQATVALAALQGTKVLRLLAPVRAAYARLRR